MKLPFSFLVSSFVIASTFIPFTAKAEDAMMQVSPVKVTATRVERDLMDVPMSVSVITAEDIKKDSATSVADLLKDIPGVTFESSGSPGITRVSIRGEDAFRTLILIDGQKLPEHKSMSGAPILIDPNAIERIEVIKGPASVLYGSDAIGGVVNIITKKETDKVLTGSISTGYFGSTNGFTQNANIAGSAKGWNYSLSASNAKHGDTETAWGAIPDSDYDQQDVRGALSYDFNEIFSAGINASYFDSKALTSSFNVVNEKYVTNGFVNVPKWEMKKVGIFAEAKNINDYFARLRTDVYYQETLKDFENQFIPGPTITAENKLDSIGASIQSDWFLRDNHYLIAGYDFSKDSLNADGTTNIPARVSSISSHKGSQTSHAVYLSMESTLPSDFTLNYGARYTTVDTEMTRAERKNLLNNGAITAAGELGSLTESKPVFNLGLVWTGIENLALRANWSQGFRVPNLDNLYITTTKGNQTINANPDLEPETSDNFELGARYMKGGFTADIAGFYSLADNYMTTVVLTRTLRGTTERYENIATAKTYGAELALGYLFENGFKPYLSGTFMRRQFDDGVRETYDTFTPKFVGRLGLAYDTSLFADKVDFNADLYVRAQSASKGYNGNTLQRHKGFGTLNLGIGTNFGKDKEWNIQAEVLNILDKEYYYNSTANSPNSAIEPGTNANVKLTYSF